MVEEDVKDFRLKYCNYCAWNIPDELIESIIESEEKSLFCEQCGADLTKENEDFKNMGKKRGSEIKTHSTSKVAEKIISKIPKVNNGIKNLKIPKEDKVDLIYDDKDFPLIFKENLVVVLARMIYLDVEEIREASSTESLQDRSLESLVNEIIIDLSPVTENQIKHGFLINLNRISMDDFESWLRKLQSKVQADQFYYVCFIEFLRELITDVLIMVLEKWDEQVLPMFERTIINDLKNFKFDSKIRTQESSNLIGINTKENKQYKKFLFENLEDNDLHRYFKEYYTKTNTYPTWGLKFKNNFWKSIDQEIRMLQNKINSKNKHNKKEIGEIKKKIQFMNQVLCKCKLIEKNQEIKNFIIVKSQSGHSRSHISRLLKKFGLNISHVVIKKEIETGKTIKNLPYSKNYKWAFLDFKKNNRALNYEEKVQKAADYVIKNILNDEFKIKHNLEEINQLKQLDLKKDYLDFVRALQNRKISYNDVLLKIGYELNMERNKWSFLDNDKQQVPLPYKEKVKKAAEFLKTEILTEELKKKYKISTNQAPTVETLTKEHGDFHSALRLRKISYNDVIEKAGLYVNYEIGKWSFLDNDENGAPLNHKQKLEKAVEYFLKEVLTEDLKEELNLVELESPTLTNLVKNNNLDFIGAIKKRALTYNQILKKAGYKLNCEIGKWKFLDFDENGQSFTYKEKINIAADYFGRMIMTKEYIKTNKLVKNEAPSVATLKNQHSDFCSAIIKRKLHYNDILEKAGFIAHDIDQMKQIGTDLHTILKRIFLEHTRGKKCNSFYEIYPSIKTHKSNYTGIYKLKRCDLSIIIDENLKALSKRATNLCLGMKKIKIINFDFYFGNSAQRAKKKCLKGYQGKGKLLILVPSHAIQPQTPPENIPYRQNVKILDPESYITLMGFNNNFRHQILKCIKMARLATWNENIRKELHELAIFNNEMILNNFKYSQKELEKFLIKKPNLSLNLLNYNPDKSVLDTWIHKNEKRNQDED